MIEHPFRYPEAQARRHGPIGYRDYEGYRPWLRDEFSFRCVYCLVREQWGRVRGTFDIDHFVPVANDASQTLVYENLVYACAACNSAKSSQLTPDPQRTLLAGDVWVEEDGTIHARTDDAMILIEMLGLNDEEMAEFRSLWIGLIALAFRYDRALFERLMSYPSDLPDLRRLKPPGGNTRPEGINESYFVRRELGLLSATY